MPGWFDFINGQTLPASRVQEFLMDQSVMKFADAGSRAAALPFPTDGMVSYLTDIDRLFVYRSTSSAWVQIAESTNLAALSAVLPARGNAIINGGFDIWQRGTSFALGAPSASQYSADRWLVYSPATSQHTASRQTAGLDGFRFALRFQRNSGSTNTNLTGLYYGSETAESVKFANQSVVLSFYARRGANYSPTANALSASIITGTGTDQNIINGWTGGSTIGNASVTLSTTWTRFTVTATVGSTANQVGVFFNSVSTGTAGANDWYEVTGVQLEAGSVATPFVRAATTLQGELAACQRYYYRSTADSTNTFKAFGQGQGANSTAVQAQIQFPVPLRVAPSAVEFSTLRVADGVTSHAVSALVINSTQQSESIGFVTATVTGATGYRPYVIQANSSASAFIGFSAEL
jgi:hypothetical protein